jgi:hypothetical protein
LVGTGVFALAASRLVPAWGDAGVVGIALTSGGTLLSTVGFGPRRSAVPGDRRRVNHRAAASSQVSAAPT